MSNDARLPSRTELIVLNFLAQKREMYGLELVRVSNNKLKRGTIYVLLSRLEDKGFVSSRQISDIGVSGLPKRVYSITGLGQRAISASQQVEIILSYGLPAT